MSRLTICIGLLSLSLAGSALAQSSDPAETRTEAPSQPVGTTDVQSPAGVTRTDNAEIKATSSLPGTTSCKSASAEMTNGSVETCNK